MSSGTIMAMVYPIGRMCDCDCENNRITYVTLYYDYDDVMDGEPVHITVALCRHCKLYMYDYWNSVQNWIHDNSGANLSTDDTFTMCLLALMKRDVMLLDRLMCSMMCTTCEDIDWFIEIIERVIVQRVHGYGVAMWYSVIYTVCKYIPITIEPLWYWHDDLIRVTRTIYQSHLYKCLYNRMSKDVITYMVTFLY